MDLNNGLDINLGFLNPIVNFITENTWGLLLVVAIFIYLGFSAKMVSRYHKPQK